MKERLLLLTTVILLSCGQNKTQEDSLEQTDKGPIDTMSTAKENKESEKKLITGRITTIADGYDVKRVNLFTSTSPDRTITCFLKNGEKVKVLLDADLYYFVEQANAQGCRGYCMKGFVVVDK
jgi:hypothetical protein